MADNRQFADHVEIGGANVYFKEEPTTDTTMANTSYFKTVDADGNPVKISRDNIMGIVKECLGTILNGLSDQTTVTKVPTLNGNTLGASTAATLASVLGIERYRTNVSANDTMTIKKGYIYVFMSGGLYEDAIIFNPNNSIHVIISKGANWDAAASLTSEVYHDDTLTFLKGGQFNVFVLKVSLL